MGKVCSSRGRQSRAGEWFSVLCSTVWLLLSHLLASMPTVPFVALSSHLPRSLGTRGSAHTIKLHLFSWGPRTSCLCVYLIFFWLPTIFSQFQKGDGDEELFKQSTLPQSPSFANAGSHLPLQRNGVVEPPTVPTCRRLGEGESTWQLFLSQILRLRPQG